MSHRITSRGESNTRWRARVSSTTPRFEPRWPPVVVTVSTMNVLISSASCRQLLGAQAAKVAGAVDLVEKHVVMMSSRGRLQ